VAGSTPAGENILKLCGQSSGQISVLALFPGPLNHPLQAGRKTFAMARPYVKGGTPVTAASKCNTCNYAHIMTGFRESEKVVMCNEVHPNIVVPFVIFECTGYYDKNLPDWEQMEKLAIDVASAPFKPVSGFSSPASLREAALTSRVATAKRDD
jgi:hypothetical protein